MTTEVDTTLARATVAPATTFLNLAGNKLRHRLGGQLNESSGAGPALFAKKQLEKLGWVEGQGLGKRRQGMSSHIQVTKRAEGLGLGESTLDPAIHQSLQANDWWKHSVGDTLSKLAAKKKKKDKKKTDDKKKKKIYSDEELFAATGGARFGMRAQTQQHGKWKRAESNISEKDEVEAMQKVEWDGMSTPVVVLKETLKKSDAEEESKSSSKKRRADGETEEERAERKRRKKEKKRQRKEEESSSDTNSSKKQNSKKEKSKDALQ